MEKKNLLKFRGAAPSSLSCLIVLIGFPLSRIIYLVLVVNMLLPSLLYFSRWLGWADHFEGAPFEGGTLVDWQSRDNTLYVYEWLTTSPKDLFFFIQFMEIKYFTASELATFNRLIIGYVFIWFNLYENAAAGIQLYDRSHLNHPLRNELENLRIQSVSENQIRYESYSVLQWHPQTSNENQYS